MGLIQTFPKNKPAVRRVSLEVPKEAETLGFPIALRASGMTFWQGRARQKETLNKSSFPRKRESILILRC
jgi:hypothetical protein